MAGKRSRAQSHEADEDDERSREETGTPESNASKRARTHQTNGHFEEQDDEVEEPVRSTKGKDRAAAQMNGDEEEFQPGSIRRVKLENFTTYEHAEFFPGPSLNMVLGPNGTGKSSLVCAICLGLGYNTNVLGRASAFGEFVKYGKKEAVVEVELQRRPKDSQNFVVTLRIDRDTNKREFLINGRPATHKQVVKLNSMMRIQIDNLCQFLPQDKVAEFAALSPVDLLAKTLQAAAPPEMLKWQDELKALFASQAEFNKQLETDNGELKRLETRQESLQGDVEKIRERERLKHEVDKFKAGRHIPAYQTARTEYSALKRQLRDLKYEAQDLQEKFEPSLKGVYAKEAYMKSIEQVVTTRERTLRHAEDAADAALNESEVLQSNINGIQNKIEVSGDQFTAKKKELGDLKRKVHDLETRHKQKPAEFSPGEWNTRIVSHIYLLDRRNATVTDLRSSVSKNTASVRLEHKSASSVRKLGV
jgi:chromosome segregation ATPase